MANMVLGSYTFASNPSSMNMIQKGLTVAHKETYTSVALFSWGATYAGVILDLEWDYMRTDQWSSLDTIYQADTAVVLNPNDGTSKTFNVHVLSLDGEYHISFEADSSHSRKNVRMRLLILSEAS
jgi:hypothetical protein